MTSRGQSRVDARGCAFAGSQRQIQIYVNRRRDELNAGIREAVPELHAADIEWVSPLLEYGCREYYDLVALKKLLLDTHAPALTEFWPTGGPHWDALAVVKAAKKHGALPVEAKSYPGEVYLGRPKATSEESRGRIDRALTDTKRWLGLAPKTVWTGKLYQPANRLAHLYFFRERAKVPAWLVNVCFENDPAPSRHTSRAEWLSALVTVRRELGLMNEPSYCADVLLPAVTDAWAEPG